MVEILDAVTDEKIMPRVDAEFAAFVLLEWDNLCQEANPGRKSSLRNRCINAISNEWQNALGIPLDSKAKRDELKKARSEECQGVHYPHEVGHRRLDPSVQIELLEKALRRAHIETEKKDKEIKKRDAEIERIRQRVNFTGSRLGQS